MTTSLRSTWRAPWRAVIRSPSLPFEPTASTYSQPLSTRSASLSRLTCPPFFPTSPARLPSTSASSWSTVPRRGFQWRVRQGHEGRRMYGCRLASFHFLQAVRSTRTSRIAIDAVIIRQRGRKYRRIALHSDASWQMWHLLLRNRMAIILPIYAFCIRYVCISGRKSIICLTNSARSLCKCTAARDTQFLVPVTGSQKQTANAVLGQLECTVMQSTFAGCIY